MTREERLSKMEELKAAVEGQIVEYNEAIVEGDLHKMTDLDDSMTEKINEYTGHAKQICFDDCVETDDPMLTAVKALTFETIAKKDSKVGEEKTQVRELITKDMPIDILALHNYVARHDKASGGIGQNKDWPYMIEKFNFLMTAQKAVDLGINPKSINDSYDMSDIARQYDLGKNPASKTNLLKTVTAIVQAMVGDEYKAVSHDVNYLLSIYSKKGRKALTVSCANHRYMRNYMMEICHRIVTGKTYDVDYKKATK